MTQFKVILPILISLISFNLLGQELRGQVGGNGGHVLECTVNGKTTLEMYEFFEARECINNPYFFSCPSKVELPGESLDEKLNIVLKNFKVISPIKSAHIKDWANAILREIKIKKVKPDYKGSREVKFTPHRLGAIGTLQGAIYPHNCKHPFPIVKQIIPRYFGGVRYTFTDRILELDDDNLVALILHEVILRDFINQEKPHFDSDAARYLNILLMNNAYNTYSLESLFVIKELIQIEELDVKIGKDSLFNFKGYETIDERLLSLIKSLKGSYDVESFGEDLQVISNPELSGFANDHKPNLLGFKHNLDRNLVSRIDFLKGVVVAHLESPKHNKELDTLSMSCEVKLDPFDKSLDKCRYVKAGFSKKLRFAGRTENLVFPSTIQGRFADFNEEGKIKSLSTFTSTTRIFWKEDGLEFDNFRINLEGEKIKSSLQISKMTFNENGEVKSFFGKLASISFYDNNGTRMRLKTIANYKAELQDDKSYLFSNGTIRNSYLQTFKVKF